MPPNLTIIASALALTALASGATGWKVATWRCDAARTEAVERAIEQAQATAKQDAALAASYETTRERTRIIYRTLEKQIHDYANPDPDCSLDDHGLRLAQAALANNTTPPDPAQPNPPLPTPPNP